MGRILVVDDERSMREFLAICLRRGGHSVKLASSCDQAGAALDELGAASVDYTLFSCYVVLAYMWAQMALVSQRKLLELGDDPAAAFYRAKLTTARFYF